MGVLEACVMEHNSRMHCEDEFKRSRCAAVGVVCRCEQLQAQSEASPQADSNTGSSLGLRDNKQQDAW
jgi:hypothetical protein